MADKVKCKDCGFLTGETIRGVIRADTNFRTTGRSDGQPLTPYCLIGAANIDEEWTLACDGKDNDRKPQLLASNVLNKERECQDSMKWMPGVSAKGHLQMNLLERQRQWELEATRELEDRNRKWRKEDRRSLMIALVVSVVLSLISAVASLIAARILPWFN